jgi:pyridoxal phosphate enzyme (YggS family)
MDKDDRQCIAERVEAVQARIAAACDRSGRNPADVELVAATKKVAPESICEAAGAGIDVVGENRVQEAAQKKELCPSTLRWHMLGHLQRNKVRHALHLFDFIHSVDSRRLLESLENEATKQGREVPVCLEINLAGEGSKYGFGKEELPAVLEYCCSLGKVNVTGLMTMPPFREDAGEVRRYFAELAELSRYYATRTGLDLGNLSMGMSHDFEVAVEEGATMVRIGSAIFGMRPAAG